MAKRFSSAVAVATALLFVSTAPAAFAQDYDWTGFYVGANVGGAWANTDNRITASGGGGTVVIPPGDINQINAIAADNDNNLQFTGGAQLGYNYQMGSVLLGLETDFGLLQIDRSRSTTFNASTAAPPGTTFTIGQVNSTDWLWTVRPRLGVAMGTWLFYATGGLAMGDVKVETSYADNRVPPNSATASVDKTKTGWTAGLGGAYAFNERWSARAEWLYADLGKVSESATTASGFATITSEANVKANIVRVGLDYRF